MPYLIDENSRLFYCKNGNGKRVLVCFHGFGQSHQVFDHWVNTIGDEFTLYQFDLYYHGNSERENKPLDKHEWKNTFKRFLMEEEIQTCEIFGFSLGARFAIASAIAMPKKVSKLILAGPDGIYLTVWYKLATSYLIRRYFFYLMNHSNKLESLINIGLKYRLINRYMAEFVRKELKDESDRMRVYTSWNNFKHLGYSKNELIKKLNESNFEKQLILGSKDYVVPSIKLLPILSKIKNTNIHQYPLKHHEILKKSVDLMVRQNDS